MITLEHKLDCALFGDFVGLLLGELERCGVKVDEGIVHRFVSILDESIRFSDDKEKRILTHIISMVGKGKIKKDKGELRGVIHQWLPGLPEDRIDIIISEILELADYFHDMLRNIDDTGGKGNLFNRLKEVPKIEKTRIDSRRLPEPNAFESE